MRPAEPRLRERLYALALRGARPLLAAAVPRGSKLARGIHGRAGALERLEAWAARERDPARPLVWVHAPSVGESLMAQAIVAALRERAPRLQVAFTHFSPSAERMAARVGGDVHDYLPWDVPADIERALRALSPAALAWVRTEAWPMLSAGAAARGARQALVNAVLPAGSSRLRAPSRLMLGPTYRRLDAVGAVSADDARRFSRLGVPLERVRVTGDARFDQVWRRVQALDRDAPLLRRLRDPVALTLVAGSTWGPDEERLVPAFAAARRGARWRLIVAPHEPDEAHLAPLEARLDAAGLEHARLARVEATSGEPPAVVVIDRVGVLADLYGVADVAYVGGGFHRAGLHSVVEPAALGVPVLFGPRHRNAREAEELERAGGGLAVRDAEALEEALRLYAGDPAIRRARGEAAAGYVRSRLGGAAANAELLLELLSAG
ncbi:MAG TPA: glycosyltransferase N-terminal domain-containing protein [Longimicrobiales bacterium]|nr:glycosyltransferase N-terminal domain-containing protein [Longimicrobiales bacterium]